ncbi:MAG: aspartate aminotransferase family protein, partial [Eudoraea sp.]|nr:aspartate aminotransferase family protein [Eudoraea sp.]
MHKIDIDLVEMTLDVMKYAINRITNVSPDLGKPMQEEELKAIAGETITADGIGGEKAFHLFRDKLVNATIPID